MDPRGTVWPKASLDWVVNTGPLLLEIVNWVRYFQRARLHWRFNSVSIAFKRSCCWGCSLHFFSNPLIWRFEGKSDTKWIHFGMQHYLTPPPLPLLQACQWTTVTRTHKSRHFVPSLLVRLAITLFDLRMFTLNAKLVVRWAGLSPPHSLSPFEIQHLGNWEQDLSSMNALEEMRTIQG